MNISTKIEQLIQILQEKMLQPRWWGIATLFIGLVGLAGWVLSFRFIVTIIPETKPISPNSAILFCLLGFSLYLSENIQSDTRFRTVQKIISAIVLFIAIGTVWDIISGYPARIDLLLLTPPNTGNMLPEGFMSPVTAGLFILSAVGLVTSHYRPRLTAYAGFVIALSGSIMILGYLYGAPLLYGGSIIPVAFLSGTGFICLGTGIFISSRPSWIQDIQKTGEYSIRFLILRLFIPLILVVLFLEGWIISWIFHNNDSTLVLFVAILTIISCAIAIVFSTSFSRTIKEQINAADQKRVKAEEALSDSLFRLKIAAESADMGFFVWNLKTDEMIWDEKTYEFFQIPLGNPVTFQQWLTFIHQEDRPDEKTISEIIQKGEFHSEFRIILSDGTEKTLEGHGTIIHSADGIPERMVGINWDITPKINLIHTLDENNISLATAYEELLSQEEEIRHQYREVALAHQEVKSAHRFTEEIISQAGEGIVVIDAECMIRTWNRIMEEYSGKPADEVIGRNIFGLFPFIIASGLESKVLRALTGEQFIVPDVFVNNQLWGQEMYFFATLAPHYDATGVITGAIITLRDITERKQVERRLIQSESLLRSSQAIAHIGGWEWDIKTNQMFWTEETYAIHQLDPEKISHDSQDLITVSSYCYDESDRQTVLDAFYRCVQYGDPYTLEFPFTTCKGKRIWIRSQAQAIFENEEIVRVCGTIMDITRERLFIEEIEKERLQLRTILDHIPDGVCMVDNRFVVQYINPVIRDLFGEPDNKPCYLYLHDRSMPCQWCPMDKIFSGESIRWEWEDSRHDRVYDLFDTRFVTPEGETNMLGFFHDITDLRNTKRKLAETNEYLTLLIRSANVPIIVWDASYQVQQFNYSLEMLSGFRQRDMLGKPFFSIFPEELRDEVIDLFHRGPNTGKLYEKEIPVQRSDATTIPVIWNAARISDKEGSLLAIIAQGRDITKERLLEEEKATALNQIKKNLTDFAILNDSIRNPLMVISMLCEMDNPDLFDNIDPHIKRIDQMVSQLDRRWMESESILNFIQKHYNIFLDEKMP